MPETLSIKEKITAAVATALEAITVANGYQIDVGEVVRPRRTGENYAPQAYGISVLQGAEEPSTGIEPSTNPPLIAWDLQIQCDCMIRLSEASTTPMDKALNAFEASVRKCLMVNQNWGGLALYTVLGPTIYPAANTGVEGVTVMAYITYQVSELDPYEQR